MLQSDKFETPRDKIEKFLLKPGAKHAHEFFDVGYTPKDVEALNQDINEGFDEKKAVERDEQEDGAEAFVIYMLLGKTKKKTFKTVWLRKNPNAKPRFITAYRVRGRKDV